MRVERDECTFCGPGVKVKLTRAEGEQVVKSLRTSRTTHTKAVAEFIESVTVALDGKKT